MNLSIKQTLLYGICCVLLNTTAIGASAAAPAVAKTMPAYQIETLATGLNFPWSLALLPDGRMLVSERSGSLRLLADGVLSAPLAGVPQAFVRGQGGLFDVALHPQYRDNGWIYLSFAWGDGKANGTRLVRGKLNGNSFDQVEVLFTAEPLKDTPAHYGARMAFMADNSLLLTIGDGFDYRESAQKGESLLGKIVRLHDDGKVPQDNPFVGANGEKKYHPAIYSLGHRNSQGIVYDPQRKLIFANEHGPKGGDEINIIRAGNNYGWPVITYGVDYSGAAITPFRKYKGMEQPLVDWTPSIAPASLAVYYGAMFPELHGDLLSAALKFKEVRWVQMQGDKPVAQQSLFKEIDARIRDVRVGSDGAIYLLTDSSDGKLLRVVRSAQKMEKVSKQK